ncbi:MAG: hypothetical protein M5U09_07150 [Gammaproteobacteria bacterium]|nr:hypothetical protein [Gammaproteobacteria bacterium]
MTAECNPEQLEYGGIGRRQGTGSFDVGLITSDGDVLCLRKAGKRIGLAGAAGGLLQRNRSFYDVLSV